MDDMEDNLPAIIISEPPTERESLEVYAEKTRESQVVEDTEIEGGDKTAKGPEVKDGEQTEEAHAAEVPAEEALAEEAPAEKAPVEEAHAKEAPTHEAPVEEVHADRVPAEGELAEKAPAEEELGEGDQAQDDQVIDEEKTLEKETKKQSEPILEEVEEEQAFVPEPPPDPAAPYDFSDSKERLREPFELQHDQIAEIEQLWELFQDYTPAYTDLDNYITEKELVFMLKSLNLMTHTPEQLQELIQFSVRPPNPKGHINYEQFLNIVKLRQRDMPIEEEIREALFVMDPERSGIVNRELLKDVLLNQGHKLTQKQLNNLIKEVDLSNDGTIGIEDIIGTMCIDLLEDDLQLLRDAVYPPQKKAELEVEEEEERN